MADSNPCYRLNIDDNTDDMEYRDIEEYNRHDVVQEMSRQDDRERQ